MGRIGIAISSLVVGGCYGSQAVQCAAGLVCPPGSRCDDVHGRCIAQGALDACAGHADGDACTLDGAPGTCANGACLIPYCGNGVKDLGEECDANDLGPATCETAGFYYPLGL